MRISRLTAALVAVPLMLSGTAGVALADDISNNLDGSVDAVAEVMALNVGGADGTTQLYVTPRNGDGKNGCNLTGDTTLDLSISSSNPAVATVSPSTVTFASCGDTKALTVTPVGEGSTTISVAEAGNTTKASFNLAPATFIVDVAAPANTAPQVAVGGVTAGTSYNKGAVPSATCVVTDAEDGPSSFPATLSVITGDYASDGIGSQTASCSYTDGGGLTASSSETYNIVDPSGPVITYELNPSAPNGDNGWYTGDVALTWNVSEPESPNSLVKTGCADQTITTDQAATDYSCSATSAGGSAAQQTVTIARDATAPTVSFDSVTAGTAGLDGWYTSDVTVKFTATDATSGPATVSQTVTSSGEGDAVVVASPAFTDAAGNTTPAGAVTETFKIDKTAPATPTFHGGPSSSYYYGNDPDAPTCTSTDAVSGVASCVVTGGGSTVGSHTYTATATDHAGNTSTTATLQYEVLAWDLKGFYSPVDMGGVWNTVKGGSTVPLKFEVFVGATELTSTTAVAGLTVKPVACPGGTAIADPIELVSTGGTSLRYDSTGGQFIQNWQTPKKPGACYAVTMTTQDASAITAKFMLK